MQTAPSADRNKGPIAEVLGKHEPFRSAQKSGTCLELASGTGQHVSFFADRFPHITFQPTEFAGGSSGPEAAAYGQLKPVFASIEAWCAGKANVRAPEPLDAGAAAWPAPIESEQWSAIYACNVCHISPFSVTQGLLAGAGRLLREGGGLFIYGPFAVDGVLFPESNVAFDQRLKAQDPEWGIRDCTAIAALAATHSLILEERVAMPANNFVLVLRKKSSS